MVFSSSLFLFLFLPCFLLLYFLIGSKLKNYVILFASIVFYAWGAPKFVFLVLGSLTINFFMVKYLHISVERSHRRGVLLFSLIINLGLLGYFKYANFFVENVNYLLQKLGVDSVAWTKVALPIGISFFTFQSLTYTVDVYRKIHAPLQKLSDYLLYILMFPQLIAGPIIRFHTIADQIEDRRYNETLYDRVLGFYRFIIGLAKKVLIANVLGYQVDTLLAGELISYDTTTMWLVMLAYTFQIYFDFSGYSDMAIGLGRMMGFNFPENFNFPYISQNITEFWRRWHITLSTWMRDYLYIPLGGSRVKSRARLYFNLTVVFLLSGLWHGASWNFVIWGAFHGTFLVLDKIFLVKLFQPLGKLPRVLITFIIVLTGWVFFRIEDFPSAMLVIKNLYGFSFIGVHNFKPEFYATLILAIILSLLPILIPKRKIQAECFHNLTKYRILILFPVVLILAILSVSYITSFGFNPFIYFRF